MAKLHTDTVASLLIFDFTQYYVFKIDLFLLNKIASFICSKLRKLPCEYSPAAAAADTDTLAVAAGPAAAAAAAAHRNTA